MASSLITGAVSLLLILTAGYIIATGILTIAETTMYAQSDVSYNQELMRQTIISMDSLWDDANGQISMDIYNNGSTSFSAKDFQNMEIFTFDTTDKILRFTIDDDDCEEFGVVNEYDIINKGMWDPSEILRVNISRAHAPIWVKFVTSNGISTSMNVEI